MDPESRAKIEQGQRLARRIVLEHELNREFAVQTKIAIRRSAVTMGLDLGLERVSIWRKTANRDLEHLGSGRTLYIALQQADYFREELFLFDATAGDVLTFLNRPASPGADFA